MTQLSISLTKILNSNGEVVGPTIMSKMVVDVPLWLQLDGNQNIVKPSWITISVLEKVKYWIYLGLDKHTKDCKYWGVKKLKWLRTIELN